MDDLHTLNPLVVREQFPALNRLEGGGPVAYLDGPGGTQVPASVIDAMDDVLRAGVSNLGGSFGASRDADRVMDEGRRAMADLFGAEPAEISFGQNMTSITFAVSRALARTWQPGDAIITTSLDHDANFTPWIRAAAEQGIEVRTAEFEPSTGILPPEAVISLLDDKVRLVAIPLASNALGTVVDVATISGAAREAGATVYVDGVHAGPHRLIDVGLLGCDYLVASAYKFFGPHTGILYGRQEALAALDFYKIRPAPSDPPGKLETGTQSFESIAGVAAAVDHLAGLTTAGGGRRSRLTASFEAIRTHEQALSRRFGEGLAGIPGLRLYGLAADDDDRVSTFAIGIDGRSPADLAVSLADRGIYAWSGHYYAVNVMDRLGVLDTGGLLRIGFVHYNTAQEVDRVISALDALA